MSASLVASLEQRLSREAGSIESSRRSLRKRASLNLEPSPSARSQAEIQRPLNGVNEGVIGPSSYQHIYFGLFAEAAPFLLLNYLVEDVTW